MLTLPVWAILLAVLQRTAPGIGYLFAFPLLAASILVLALPMRRAAIGRVIAAVVGVVAGALWIPLVWPLVEFVVGLFGSLPVVAPTWLFPAIAVALMLDRRPVPGRSRARTQSPAGCRRASSPRWLLLAVVAVSWVMAVEPAYTPSGPSAGRCGYVQDLVQRQAWWEAGTHERDLAPVGHPRGRAARLGSR